MKYKDYYKVLGVERSATTADIKKAYRKLAHLYHPDVSKDAQGEEKFKEAAEAYATLKDPEKRREYDELGSHAAGEQFTPPPQWREHYGGQGANFDDVDLADLFAAFGARSGPSPGGRTRSASGGRGRAFPRPGQDFEVATQVPLERLYAGGEIDVSVELPEQDEHGVPRRVPRTFRINVPKGATDGQRLRLPGKGGQGAHGGPAGDLYVKLSLAPHPLYRLQGRDISIDLPLTPWEAALGASIALPTPGGTVELSIKPGTISGRRLRLSGRGLPAPDGPAGDLYAEVRIDVPQTLSSEERELFLKLATESKFNPRRHWPGGQGK
jgi:curved DNA-binding protein